MTSSQNLFLVFSFAVMLSASSAQARFLQTDPIGYDDQVNLYAYVTNDPLNNVDPTGREIVVTWHRVLPPLPQNHAAVRIIPENQAAYSRNPHFQNILPDGRRYATLSGGPSNAGILVAGPNRSSDLGKQDGQVQVQLPNSVKSEDSFISRLFSADRNYADNRDYDLFPARDGTVAAHPGNDGYNSNSYAAGLLGAAGAKFPSIPNAPGADRPLPKTDFGRPFDQGCVERTGSLCR